MQDGRERSRPFLYNLSLRASGSRECAPDDRLRETIRILPNDWFASSFALLAMTARVREKAVQLLSLSSLKTGDPSPTASKPVSA
jgi:hypothetical protein